MVYSISYVLKTSGRDYNSLIDAIKALVYGGIKLNLYGLL